MVAQRRLAAAAVLLVAGCSKLPVTDDAVVALELRNPPAITLQNGQSITLHARALDADGDEVTAATIRWRTSDTTLVTVDSVSGMVTAIAATGSARVQASVGALRSDPVLITLQAAPTSGVRARP